MSMSSYEVVRRAIEFSRPDRLPLRFDALGVSDVHRVRTNQILPSNYTERKNFDEWRCCWVRSQMANMGQVKGHPLENWGTDKGGFILSDYGEGEAIGVEVEKKKIMLEAFQEFDPWKRYSISLENNQRTSGASLKFAEEAFDLMDKARISLAFTHKTSYQL